jgi:hypothetical protein
MNQPSRRRIAPWRAKWLAGAGAAGCAAVLVSCSGPSANDRFTFTTPDSAAFKLVSPSLELRCGTLDCHGSTYRNMRLFGHYGARLDPKLTTGKEDTTDAEIESNFTSVVSIDSENFAAIVAKHGQGFDQWMVVLKGENAVHHKGEQRMKKGDFTYNCLLSWITGNVDMNACSMASMVAAPSASASAATPDGTPPASAPPP